MDDKKRILLIMPYGGVGGMERLAVTFYDHYKSQGHTVLVIKFIGLDSDIVNFGDDEVVLKTKDFNEMTRLERLRFYATVPFTIRRFVQKNNITHSISFGDMANMFSSVTYTREFKIGSIHALKSVEFENDTYMNKIYKKCYRTTYGNLDKLVCISKAIKDDLLTKCHYKFEPNLQVIYNPHNLNEIRKMALEDLESEDEKFLFSKDVVLFLGRLSFQKASWHLINAFHIMAEEHPEAHLVFVGDGDSQVLFELNRRIKEYQLEDRVTFLGRRKNPYKFLSRAKVLALTSYYEGTPNVIVEALALDVPVVSSFCTKGVSEMMSLTDQNTYVQATDVEGGIITPTFYNGKLGIPDSQEITEEERIFAKSLLKALKTDALKTRIIENRSALLHKYDVKQVCSSYLTNISA